MTTTDMQDVLAGRARWAVVCADALDALKQLPDGCCDAVVTDPPYALTDRRGGAKGFMSAAWDNGSVAHDPAFWAEVLRVARPGAFLLAFGGTRTYHRLACAIEDAGWELRDMIVHWIYGSGFPKSKSCLKPSHEPIVLAKAPGPLQPLEIDACRLPTVDGTGRPKGTHNAFPFSDDSWGNGHLTHTEGHSGGRWPPNTLLSHVGGPQGCVPAGVRRVRAHWSQPTRGTLDGSMFNPGDQQHGQPVGYADAEGYEQVQAYSCVPQCPIRLLDEQAGPRPVSGSARNGRPSTAQPQSMFGGPRPQGTLHDETGSASRFFPTFPGADPAPGEQPDAADVDEKVPWAPFLYCSKASRRDRGGGLEAMEPGRSAYRPNDPDEDSLRTRLHGPRPHANDHPTCKPTSLMAWLCKLVTKEGGVVLDCFGGSGSTGVAAVREGMRALIIEQDAHYCDIARARIAHAEQQMSGPLFAGVAPSPSPDAAR